MCTTIKNTFIDVICYEDEVDIKSVTRRSSSAPPSTKESLAASGEVKPSSSPVSTCASDVASEDGCSQICDSDIFAFESPSSADDAFGSLPLLPRGARWADEEEDGWEMSCSRDPSPKKGRCASRSLHRSPSPSPRSSAEALLPVMTMCQMLQPAEQHQPSCARCGQRAGESDTRSGGSGVSLMLNAHVPDGQRPRLAKLNTSARPFVPGQLYSAPAPQIPPPPAPIAVARAPSLPKAGSGAEWAAGVIASVRRKITKVPGVLDVKVTSGPTTLIVVVAPDDLEAARGAQRAAKSAVLNAAATSLNTYVVGYLANPFYEEFDGKLGFKATLGLVRAADEDSACWSYFETGACQRGPCCHLCHPDTEDLEAICVRIL